MADLNGNGIDDSKEFALANVNKIFIPGVTDDPASNRGGVQPLEAKIFFKNLRETSRPTYNAILQGLAARGIKPTHKNYNTVMSNAVEWTQSLLNPLRGNPQGINPIDYLNYIDASSIEQPAAKKKYGSSRQIQETTTQYSASKAAADATEATKQELGREASAKEVAAYTKQANLAAKEEPSIYDATTTTSPGKGGVGLSKTTATNKTGFDPTMFAQNFARTLPDYAESYAAKNFLTAVQKVIGQAPTIEQGIQ